MKEEYALTWSFLNARVKRYKMTAIVTMVVFLFTLGMAIGFWNPTFLFGLLLIPGIVLLWLTLDTVSVAKWEISILDKWKCGDFPIALFAGGLKANSGPIAHTIQALIHLLPVELGDDAPTAEAVLSVTGKSRERRRSQWIKLGLAWMAYTMAGYAVLAYLWKG
jgi:hypothetical protein